MARKEIGEKVQIIFPTIVRWHCVDLVIENIKLAVKPRNVSMLIVCPNDEEYIDHLKKKLKEIGIKYEIVINPEEGIEHDIIRPEITSEEFSRTQISYSNIRKTDNIFRTYKLAIEHCDKTADYYWIIEDDNLFPLDSYTRLKDAMRKKRASISSGLSWHWHSNEEIHNFWQLTLKNSIPFLEAETKMSIELIPKREKGIDRIGATGFCNMLTEGELFRNWKPIKTQNNWGSGADICYCAWAYINGKTIAGIWDLELPHITKYDDGKIRVIGKIDQTLFPLFGGYDK